MDGLGPIDIDILINNPALLRSLRQAEQDVQNANRIITDQAKQTSNQLDGWAKKAAVAAGSYFSIAAAKNFIAELVNVRGEFEQLTIAYETILRSKQKGDALFAQTVNFAATTPFNLTEVATATKQLLAYGFAAKDINDVLTTTGNIAAGVSAPLGDIVYLYGTLKTQGRAYAQDIRQFTGRGIPIIQELAKQFGVTADEVNKLVEQGKVGFPEVEKAFKSLTGSSGIFYNLMEKQSHTLTGQLSNLQDAFSQMLNSIGESNQGLLSGGIQLAASLVSNYQKVLDIVEELIIVYGAYRAALLLQAAASAANAAAIGLETVAYRLLRDGLAVLNTEKLLAVATTAAYTAAISALVLALKAWHDASAMQNEINSQANTISSDAVVKVDLEKAKIGDLVKVINDHNNTQDQRISALKKLNAISPEYLGNITLETANTKEASKAIKNYLADLDKKLEGEAAYSQKLENLKKIAELKTKGVDAIGSFQRVGLSMQRFFSFNSSAKGLISSDQDNEDTVNQLIATYTQANNKIDKLFGEQIKKTIAGTDEATKEITSKFKTDLQAAMAGKTVQPIIDAFNNLLKEANGKEQLDELEKALQAKLDTLVPGDKDQVILRNRIAQVKKLLRSYNTESSTTDENSALNAAQRHAEILQKIYQLNEKYNAQSLDDDSQKIQAIRAEYDKLRADIDKYNANPKNVKVSKDMLQSKEQTAINNQVEQNETKGIADDVEKRKALYEEYYAYRERLGDTAAAKEYADLLAGGKDFQTYLDNIQGLVMSSDLSPNAFENLKKMFAKYSIEIKKQDSEKNADLLASTLTYEQQRALIIEKYEKQAADLQKQGKADQAAVAIQVGKEQLTQLDDQKIQSLEAYKELYDGLHKISVQRAKEDIAILLAYADNEQKTTGKTSDAILKLKKVLSETSEEIADLDVKKLSDLGGFFTDISGSFSSINSGLGDLLGGLGKTLTQLSAIQKLSKTINSETATASEKSAAKTSAIEAGISGAVQLIGMVIDASNQRKAAEEAYYNSILRYQNQLNLSLIDQIRLREQLTSNVFLKDYKADILNASEALAQANKDFTTSLAALQAGQAKVGTHNAVNGKSVLGGVGAGAAAGAAIGAVAGVGVLSVPAAAVGAIVGGLVGGIVGLFGGKKKVDTLAPLLEAYPALIKTKDGVQELDEALAKNLIQNNLVSDSTKVLLQNTIDLNDARQASIDQINSDIKDLSGSLGDDLRNALVEAFETGENAAKKFEGKVSDVISNIVSQFLFNDIFGSQFDTLEARLKGSLGIAGDQNVVDDLTDFYKNSGPAIKQFQDAMQAAKDAAKAQGIDIFTNPNDNSTSAATMTGEIKGITEDTANILEGSIHGMQLAVVQANGIATNNGKTLMDQLAEQRTQTMIQMQIQVNTKRTADNTDEMKVSLKSIDDNTSSTSLTNVLRAAGK